MLSYPPRILLRPSTCRLYFHEDAHIARLTCTKSMCCDIFSIYPDYLWFNGHHCDFTLELNEEPVDETFIESDEDRKLYEKAMKSGFFKSAFRLLIFLGVAGSGKSLFQRLVLGQLVPDDSSSTALAESAVRSMSICQVAVDGGVKWVIVKPQEMTNIVAKAIKEREFLEQSQNTSSQKDSVGMESSAPTNSLQASTELKGQSPGLVPLAGEANVHPQEILHGLGSSVAISSVEQGETKYQDKECGVSSSSSDNISIEPRETANKGRKHGVSADCSDKTNTEPRKTDNGDKEHGFSENSSMGGNIKTETQQEKEDETSGSILPQGPQYKCSVISVPEALKEIKIDSKIIQKFSEPSTDTKLMDVDFIYLLDSGGQPPFREMLPHFVQQASAIVLMQKLNERLDFKPTIRYREGGEGGRGYKSQLTNEQILSQYIQAIRSHKSKVFFVGTHRDKRNECEETLNTKNMRLIKTFRPVIGSHIVPYQMGDVDQYLFPVDSTSREKEDLATSKAFREKVMNNCMSVEKRIPLPWFVLEQLLQLLAEKMEVKVLSTDECFEAAEKKLHMSRDDCTAAMKYLSELGIIFYRPRILPDTVFCNAQVVLDKITELVRCSHLLRTDTTDIKSIPLCMHGDKGFQFRDLGLIDAELLGKAYPSHYREPLFTPPDFLKLLKGLLIAGELAGGKYFMPSLLPNLSLEEIAKYRVTSPENPAPLTIFYPKMCLPVGVMPSLIVYLQNSCSWTPIEEDGKPACMYHNCFQFKLPGGKSGNVVLIDSTKFLEVHVSSKFKETSILLQNITTGLDAVHKSLNYNLTMAEVEVGFLCTGECGNKKAHPALNNNNETWRCSEKEEKDGDLQKGQKVWSEALKKTSNGWFYAMMCVYMIALLSVDGVYLSFFSEKHCK